MAIFAVLQRHLSPSAFLLIFVAPIGALRIIAFGDFPAGVDMRRSGALYQVINRKQRRRAEARLGGRSKQPSSVNCAAGARVTMSALESRVPSEDHMKFC
jgi:hypothetical protein